MEGPDRIVEERAGLLPPAILLQKVEPSIAVHVADAEVDRLLARLEQLGVDVEGPIQLGPGKAIYVTDPDGNVVEFWSQDMTAYTSEARAGGPPGTFASDERR